jgi:ribosomal protein S18 acetylase RimI-like enzyme
VNLREATLSDAEALFRLTHAAFLEFASDVPPPSALFETEDDVQSELEHGAKALLAERDGKLLGAVRYSLEREVLHFFRLAVAPSARRQGVAASLLLALEERAKASGCTKINCHVRTRVTRNVQLYEHRGYALVGGDIQVRGGFAIRVGVMEKDLSPTPLPATHTSLGKGIS